MKIFLSSTCYDLADLRAEVERFLTNSGHELLLSDRTTFPVKARQHRHYVCIENVKLCDLLIAIVDKRYGAPYYQDPTISITWAELRKAIEFNKDIIAFVRKEIFNERQTCRHNQKKGNIFTPFFTDNIKTFDLIDEIQQNESGIWIQPFENSVEIKERLENLYETKHSLINPKIESTAIDTTEVSLAALSGSTASFITNYVEKTETETINVQIIQKAIDSIPEGLHIWGEILGCEQIPGPNDYYFFTPIRHSGDEGEMIIGISPTALGKAVRNELIDIRNNIGQEKNKKKNGS